MVERLLLREHRLQAGGLGVDLVLDDEQGADASGVLEQRPQLADGRLVRRDLAADIGDLLGHVLRLLPQGELGAEPGPGQPGQRGRVDGGRDLQRHGRGRARGGLAGPRAGAVLGRDVAAGRRHDRRRRRQRGADVLRPDGELGGVDELLIVGDVAGGGVLRCAAAVRLAVPAAAKPPLEPAVEAALAAALADGRLAAFGAWAAAAPGPEAAPSAGALLLAPLEQPASAASVAMMMMASPGAVTASRRRRGAMQAAGGERGWKFRSACPLDGSVPAAGCGLRSRLGIDRSLFSLPIPAVSYKKHQIAQSSPRRRPSLMAWPTIFW